MKLYSGCNSNVCGYTTINGMTSLFGVNAMDVQNDDIQWKYIRFENLKQVWPSMTFVSVACGGVHTPPPT